MERPKIKMEIHYKEEIEELAKHVRDDVFNRLVWVIGNDRAKRLSQAIAQLILAEMEKS